jgi:DNA polymerase-4
MSNDRAMKTLCRDCFWTSSEPARRCGACGSPRVVAHPELATLTIAHLDCDAFYASVEKRDRPELRDLPVIVGGGVRGVVTTCCYIARISGVRSAMPMFKALKLCPEAVVIKPNFPKYITESKRIFERLRALTPLVQTLSLDEAWTDLGGTERLHGAPAAVILARLQAEIEREIGLPVSIGLAANKFLAKIASDLDKPRGFAVIGEAEARAFLAPRPVGILPGVGPAFVKTLEKKGLRTVGDLAASDPTDLAKWFGVSGTRLAQLSKGLDARAVNPDGDRKSISAETTFDHDLKSIDDLENRLWPLCEKVARRARIEGVAARTVVLKLRRPDFSIVTRRRAAPSPTQTAKTAFAIARDLLRVEAGSSAFRLIGVGFGDLVAQPLSGDDFFPTPEDRNLASERAVDAVRGRFGDAAIVTGRGLRS